MRSVRFDDYRGAVSAIGVRVAPIDVGFDLRRQGTIVSLPVDTTVASYADDDGERWVCEGTCEEIAAVLRENGYRVRVEPRS